MTNWRIHAMKGNDSCINQGVILLHLLLWSLLFVWAISNKTTHK